LPFNAVHSQVQFIGAIDITKDGAKLARIIKKNNGLLHCLDCNEDVKNLKEHMDMRHADPNQI
jgi:hypothetical protein